MARLGSRMATRAAFAIDSASSTTNSVACALPAPAGLRASESARAWMACSVFRDASPSFEVDDPAHARAVRGGEVVSGEHVRRGEQGRVKGKTRSPGASWLQNCGSGRPIMSNEQIDERTAKKDSKGDRQVGFWGGRRAGLRSA